MSVPYYQLEDARCHQCDAANLDNPARSIDTPCPTNDGLCAHCCWSGQWSGDIPICPDCEAIIAAWKAAGNAA